MQKCDWNIVKNHKWMPFIHLVQSIHLSPDNNYVCFRSWQTGYEVRWLNGQHLNNISKRTVVTLNLSWILEMYSLKRIKHHEN